MDKMTILQDLDLEAHQRQLDACLDDYQRKQVAVSRFRLEMRDYLPNGNAESFALQLEEARLLALAQGNNDMQRRASLLALKHTDEGYARVAEECAQRKSALDQLVLDADIAGKRWLQCLEALKVKRATLRFLAED